MHCSVYACLVSSHGVRVSDTYHCARSVECSAIVFILRDDMLYTNRPHIFVNACSVLYWCRFSLCSQGCDGPSMPTESEPMAANIETLRLLRVAVLLRHSNRRVQLLTRWLRWHDGGHVRVQAFGFMGRSPGKSVLNPESPYCMVLQWN